MIIEHNSRLPIYRTPFGATEAESVVTLSLYLADFGIPHHIRVVMVNEDGEEAVNMSYVYALGNGYMYQAEVTMPKATGLMFYYFDVASDKGRFYYGNNPACLGGMGSIYIEKPEKLFQITIYEKGFKTPDWWKKSVCYQIFPDRFANGNEDGSFLGDRCDIIKRNWGDMPYYKPEQFGGEYLANDFFGGNLLGIEKKLDYLADLGISAIYLNPIFKAYSNHKYDTGDYKEIDEMVGQIGILNSQIAMTRQTSISLDESALVVVSGGSFEVDSSMYGFLYKLKKTNNEILGKPNTYVIKEASYVITGRLKRNIVVVAENGVVTASVGSETVAAAKERDTVTLTVTPNNGYELDSVTVKDAEGNAVEVTDNTVTMPRSAVTVTATFTALVAQ